MLKTHKSKALAQECVYTASSSTKAGAVEAEGLAFNPQAERCTSQAWLLAKLTFVLPPFLQLA